MVNQEIIAILYGIASATLWGTSDFLGGFATKSSSLLGVLLIVYITGFVLLAISALWLGSPVPNFSSLLAGASAGVTAVIGLAALYQGLAIGRMGMVAPLTAILTAALPVLFGMFLEGSPSSLQITGFLVAFAAIWLLSAPEKSQKIHWRQLGLPAVAGICFGLSLILIDKAAEQNVLWPLVAARTSGIALLITLLIIFRTGNLPRKHRYTVVLFAGIFEIAGTAFYALAAQTGRLDISAVLVSMYPAATVLLARLILKERLSRRQWTGVMASLFALALIAA